MKISLIIPSFNEEKYIGNCLESIQKYGTELFEVIVIDNASTDKTAEIARNFPNIRVVKEQKKGLPFARNRGLSEASGDVVAFIDADTKIPKDWVSKIIKEFQKNDNITSISGPYIYYDMPIIQKMLVWMYWIFLAWPSYLFIGYMAVLGNFAAKKESLQKVGGFNENVSFYGDDTDIAKKLNKIGKVKFLQSFYMYTSARRFKGEGILATSFKYTINFLSVVFRDKPQTPDHKDIR